MATNNAGHSLDSSGNLFIDYVWGNLPIQPNDERVEDNASPVVVVAANADQNNGWSGYSTYPSERLNPALDSHSLILAGYSNYPAFTASKGNAIVTAASSDGTTVTYTAQNNFVAGQTVTVTGLTTSAFNLSAVTVATADAVKFTVTNTAVGAAVTGGYGRAEDLSTVNDGAFIDGVAFVKVPNVLGLTTASASDALKDAGMGTITTATAATNAAKTVTAAARTAGSTTITITASSHAFVAGNSVTITSVDATVNGTYSVVSATTHTFTVVGTATTVLALTGLTGSVVAVAGTIKAQSVAGGADSISAGTAVTITPWAAAS